MEKEKKVLNKTLILGIFALALLGIFIVNLKFASAAGTYCAERTTFNGTCQNVPLSQVNKSFAYAPTSCQYTSFCRAGTCVDTNSGNCMPNTASYTCGQSPGGVWYDDVPDNLPLCKQGCCLIGDQAAFVTQTRCNQLSTQYSLSSTFRSDITDEATCLASAQPQAKGACVYETSAGRTCKFTTKQDCQTIATNGVNTNFHSGFLCSNPDLGTNCAPTDQTTCLPGKDQVYFVDSCGNPANVYNSDMFRSKGDYNISYWSYTPGINGVANPAIVTSSSTNDVVKKDGNCDYYSGTTCRQFDSSIDGNSKRPSSGSYLCRSLSCSSAVSGTLASNFNKTYGYFPQNGETWCGTENSKGIQLGDNVGLTGGKSTAGGITVSNLDKGNNLPGSRDVRFVCYNGEVTVEPCADYRQEICSQTTIEGTKVKAASCVVNRWRDCYSQTSNTTCLDTGKRDCEWVVGVSIRKDSNGVPLVMNNRGSLVAQANITDSRPGASCVPRYAPGLSDSEAQQVCSIASTNCLVTFSTDIFNRTIASQSGSWWNKIFPGISPNYNYRITCFNDNGTVVQSWLDNQTNICYSLGDCGVSSDYLGGSGLNTKEDLYIVIQGNNTNSSS